MPNPVYRFSLVVNVDESMNRALQFAADKLQPRKSKSEIIREAIYSKLSQEIPGIFEARSEIPAE